MRVSESRDCLQAMPSESILEQASAWSKLKVEKVHPCVERTFFVREVREVREFIGGIGDIGDIGDIRLIGFIGLRPPITPITPITP